MSVLTFQSPPRLSLAPNAVAVPALTSHVRPALVLAERETRDLLDITQQYDVLRGGRFATGPTGIQVWSSAWDGPNSSPGNAIHLGSVDWALDTPSRGYATVYRTIVTAAGVEAGETTESILRAVLALADIPLDGSYVMAATPPPRDPFRSSAQAQAS